jgi:hypothetical protein
MPKPKVTKSAALMQRLVSFAEADLGELRYGDVKRLLVDILQDGRMTTGVGNAAAGVEAWRPLQTEGFRQEVRSFFHALAADEEGERDVDRTEESVLKLAALRFHAVAASGGPAIELTGAARDVLWFQILDLLRAVGIRRIRRCSGCPRLFVRTGRQEHCTPACSQRSRSRRFYRENRARISEARHEAYKRKRRRSQPGVPVARRPRR